MILAIIFLLFYSHGVHLYRHQKPLEEKIWSDRCKRNSMVLNDCNWCWCDDNQRFQCKARVCDEVDMFGHFKDAIQEIDVGMEGHGAWRSKPTSCKPGVRYQRDGVLCVCDENGNWPNPVCRDLFRVLHSVEVTGQVKASKNETCEPTKLYLIGCNVCFCSSAGSLDPELCTKKECDDVNPVLEAQDDIEILPAKNTKDLEVYATCDPNYKYKLDNMNCDCIRNNRLICDDSPSDTNGYGRTIERKNYKSYCTGKSPGKIFNVGCNFCHCDKKQNIYCTAKKCIRTNTSKLKSQFKVKTHILWEVEAPADDESCTPGTKYKRDCNICKCASKNGVKIIDCSVMKCAKRNAIEDQKHDCVNDTIYEIDCKICYCVVFKKVKRQVCQVNSQCANGNAEATLKGETQKKRNTQGLDSLHGYCEPLHKYRKDCNNCRCLSDGKTLMCTSMMCITRSSDSLSVDVVPVYMKGDCPKGHSYKLDCNTCYCLSNGNAICTTADCSNKII